MSVLLSLAFFYRELEWNSNNVLRHSFLRHRFRKCVDEMVVATSPKVFTEGLAQVVPQKYLSWRIIIKTRLNMLPVFANYKGDVSMEKTCAHCKMADDNTEHLVECRQLGDTILKREDICNDENPELWKLLNERIQYNLMTGERISSI